MPDLVLAIDIGGTKIAAGLIDRVEVVGAAGGSADRAATRDQGRHDARRRRGGQGPGAAAPWRAVTATSGSADHPTRDAGTETARIGSARH